MAAWLRSQDGDGVRFVTESGGRPQLVPSHEFFTAYREADAGKLGTAPAPRARSKGKSSKKPRGGRQRGPAAPTLAGEASTPATDAAGALAGASDSDQAPGLA